MLDRNSSVSMYEQIVDILKEEILQKRVAGSGCLGTHKDLAEKYNVSLITIRKALQILQDQGIVEIKQGKGTFVSRHLLANRHNFFSSYVDLLYGADNDVSNTRLVEFGPRDTPKHFSAHIQDMMGPTCHLVERVYSLDNRVMGYCYSYLPRMYGEQIDLEDARNRTVYELYTEKLDICLGKGFQRIRALAADSRLAFIFNIPEGTPMIHIERESYSDRGEFLELAEMYCQYSQYEYTISLEFEKKPEPAEAPPAK